jgi:hypothetical protein
MGFAVSVAILSECWLPGLEGCIVFYRKMSVLLEMQTGVFSSDETSMVKLVF